MSSYTWPSSIIPSSSEWRLIANTAAFSSPLTGVTRTLARGGDRWACTLSFNALHETSRRTLQAFIARLRGQAHRVVLPDHSFTRAGTLAGTPLVKGASQTGVSLLIDGCTQATTLLAGDLFAVNGELKMCVLDATASAGGEITVQFVPPLRSSPADNAAVTVASPTGTFMLADNTVGWSNNPAGWPRIVSSFTLEFVEDIA
jgi:hypothetical protein